MNRTKFIVEIGISIDGAELLYASDKTIRDEINECGADDWVFHLGCHVLRVPKLGRYKITGEYWFSGGCDPDIYYSNIKIGRK